MHKEKRAVFYFAYGTALFSKYGLCFFKDLGLPKPKYNLGLGNLNYNEQVGKFTRGISEILKKEKPNWVLVQGDTTTVLAGALAANKLGIKVAHHEAGL